MFPQVFSRKCSASPRASWESLVLTGPQGVKWHKYHQIPSQRIPKDPKDPKGPRPGGPKAIQGSPRISNLRLWAGNPRCMSICMNTSKFNDPTIHGNRKELAAIIRYDQQRVFWCLLCVRMHSHGIHMGLATDPSHFSFSITMQLRLCLANFRLPTCVGMLVAIVEAIGLCFPATLPPG